MSEQDATDPVPAGFEPIPLGGGYTDTIGEVYIDRARGRLGWRVRPEHLNPFGICHGGALATFADWQGVLHMGVNRDPAAHTPTVSLTVDYLAPILVDAWVEAEVTIDRMGSTLIFSRAIFMVSGETVARSTAIYRNNRKHGNFDAENGLTSIRNQPFASQE